MKKFAVFFSALILFVAPLFSVDTQSAGAGYSDYISPYFSAYFSDETQGKILEQNNLFDMSAYTGNATGKFSVTTEYTLESVRENAEFCYPVSGALDSLSEVKMSVDGVPLQTEVFYGDSPSYYAGENIGHLTVQDAIASVKPTEIDDGIGVLYTFEPNTGELSYSFTKSKEQTVMHDGTEYVSMEQGNYEVRLDSTLSNTYRLFVIGGDLQNLTANLLYTREETTYKAYADYYVDEMIAEFGEQYRGVCYSRFNRLIDGSFHDVIDVFYNFENYGFALIKAALPAETVKITVNSYIFPLVNELYKPTIYLIRSIASCSSQHATTTQIKLSEEFPYIIASNVEIENNVITAEHMKNDFYYVVSSEKKPENVLSDNNARERMWLIVAICCGVIGVGGLTVTVILGIREKRGYK